MLDLAFNVYEIIFSFWLVLRGVYNMLHPLRRSLCFDMGLLQFCLGAFVFGANN